MHDFSFKKLSNIFLKIFTKRVVTKKIVFEFTLEEVFGGLLEREFNRNSEMFMFLKDGGSILVIESFSTRTRA